MNKPTQLSVIVACVEADRTIERCLAALHTACDGILSEVIVVHHAGCSLSERIQRIHPSVRVVSVPRSALVPELWAQGLRASCGRAVAFTTGHCIVPREWAQALLKALGEGTTGAGGALQLGPDTGIIDWAVYFLRYSAFMPPAAAGEVAEIPGDNAAYLRSALERHRASVADGFWEVDFHRRVHSERGRLVCVPGATTVFGPSFSFAGIFRQRYLHGRHFGEYRVSGTGQPRWRGVLAAPVVPFLLVSRILRRVARRPELRLRALLALPVLFPLAAAWAAGEARGALRARRAAALKRSRA